MNRLFILTPNLKMSHDLVIELEGTGIAYDDTHVVAKRSDLLKLAHLHEATILQTTDTIPSLIRGAVIGVVFSIMLCFAYAYALPANYKINPFIILAILVFGVLLGAWISSLIGVSVNNPLVEKYDKYVQAGECMIIIDAHTPEQAAKVKQIVQHHTDVKIVD